MKSITCLNCAGTGYITTRGLGGFKRPIICRGCNGTGTQQVKS